MKPWETHDMLRDEIHRARNRAKIAVWLAVLSLVFSLVALYLRYLVCAS